MVKSVKWLMIVVSAALLWGCSSTRHVPAGQRLLDKAQIVVDDTVKLKTSGLYNYLRQVPNHKVLGFARLQLGIYNMSGSDSTRGFNRWLRKIGQAPVLLGNALTE